MAFANFCGTFTSTQERTVGFMLPVQVHSLLFSVPRICINLHLSL